MFGYFKRKRVRVEIESAQHIHDSSLRARAAIHIAIDEVQHDAKYTKYADDPELVTLLFESLKRAAKTGVDEVLLGGVDPFGEEIKLNGTAAIGAGMLANGIRNEFILLGNVNQEDVNEKMAFHINRIFEQIMDETLT